jgi:hypothetical protein
MYAPTKSHWAVVKLILRYLKGTSSYGLHLTRGSSLSLHGFTDADWARSTNDQKSTGGYIVFLGTTPISWKYGKQRTVDRSSTEVEYKALADGTAEGSLAPLSAFQIYTSLPILLPPFGPIIWALLICLLIRCFIHVESMLRLIITSFVIEWLKRRYKFTSYPPKTK